VTVLWKDVRYAARTLAKSPAFTAIAIVTLALGIGANTALFSVVKGVLLSPLPFPEPQQLVAVYWKTAQSGESAFSFLNFIDCRKDNHTFAAMGAYRWEDFNLTGVGEPERLDGEMVSANFFPLLGVKPILGRTFRSDEDEPGARPVVLISEALWSRRFSSSPGVLGSSLTLNGVVHTVIGVIPARLPIFDPYSMDIFVPIGQRSDTTFLDRKVVMGTLSIGRLRPGVTLAQARADMDTVAGGLAAAYPDADKGAGISVVLLKKDVVGDVQGILLILLGAVSFVLLIACANVANLLLARASGRTREFALRAALGASRMRIIRQLLTESILLAVTGGALGLAIARWGTRVILATLPTYLPRTDNVHLDSGVLVLTLAVSVFAGIIFGLAPALETQGRNLAEALKQGGPNSSGGRRRGQSILVALEMALSVVLLVGTGLMIRTFAALRQVDLGFNPHNVLTFSVGFSADKLTNPARIRASIRDSTAKFESAPGIEAASEYAGSLPMFGDSQMSFWIEGQPKPNSESEMNVAMWHAVQPGFIRVMGISLLRGRFLSAQDNEASPAVVVIDENFARQFFPNEDPIGKQINTVQMDVHAEIVGIVGHVQQWGVGDTAHQNRQSQFYFSLAQIPDPILHLFSEVGGVVRTRASMMMSTDAVRAASAQFDSNQIVSGFRTMDSIVSTTTASQRSMMILLGGFAAIALLLSVVGVYGVISYVVSQRTREIGVRMALGAQREHILRLILGKGFRLALLGLFFGIAAACGLSRLLANLLFGVSATDPVTFISAAVLLMLVAILACYVPARRAMRVDPMVALKYE
jgi:predicted permease